MLGDISKNEQIQFFDSQMLFSIILAPWMLHFFATMVQYTGLTKNSNIFVYHFVDSDLRVGTFRANVWKKFHTNFKKMSVFLLFCFFVCLFVCFCFCFLFFGDKKIAFKSSLDLYFHPSVFEFRMEEKIHTKAVVDVSRGAGGRIFLGEIRG